MDIDPPRLSSRSANHSNLQDTSPSSLASHPTSFHGSDGANQSASSRSRLLRTRPSDPLPGPPTVAKHTSPVASIRKPLQKELNNIHRRLDSEWVKSRREELLREKERHLKRVVDGHDDAVREKFHLEKFVSLLEGWDPGEAKNDNSPVFQEYRRSSHHDLLDLVPSPPMASSSAVAGPSRPRGSLPARTTRRQAHEQSELLANVITPMAGNGHSTLKRSFPLEDIKAPASSLPTSTKDKTRLVEDGQRQVSNGRTPLKIRLSMGSKPLSPATDMPPPPLPSSFDSAAKRSRRATTQGVALSPLDEPETEEPMSKGKKRARISLPNLLAAKKLRGATDLVVEAQGSSSSLIEVPVQSQEPSPALTSLPSFAYFSFPPPPLRQRERSAGLRQVSYTDPTQRLPPNTQYSGEIAPIMSSYIHIEDTGPPPDLRALELRAAREAYYRNRVNYLQQKGRLLRLLDGALDDPKSANKSHHKVITGPPLRQSDHQDAMTSQMLQVRNAIVNEARMKPQVCKRVSRMVQTYWEHIEGKEDRERSAEEKEKRRKARDVARAMKKRWGLAVKVVRAKVLAAQKLEQDRLGKEHLQNMLQRSTGLLEAQRDDIAGPGIEAEDEEEDESDSISDVSAANEGDLDEGPANEEGEDHFDDGLIPTSDVVDSVDPGMANEEEEGDGISQSEKNEENEGEHSEGEEEGEDEGREEEDEDGEGEEDFEEDDDSSNVLDLRALIADDIEMPDDVEAAVSSAMRASVEATEPDRLQFPVKLDVIPASTVDDQRFNQLSDNVPDQSITSVGIESMPAMSVGVDVGSTLGVIAEQASPLTTLDPFNASSSTHHTIANGHTDKVNSVTDSGDPLATSISNDRIQLHPDSTAPFKSILSDRSRRSRKHVSIAPATASEDPDVNDAEFEDATSDIDEQDYDLDVTMEVEDDFTTADSEDEGLLADADVPIDELLKRYGYSIPSEPADIKIVSPEDEPRRELVLDEKSLLNNAFPATQISPALVVEGKRQRRVRAVWTPEDNPPPALKKHSVANEDEEIEDISPELSSEAEDEDESEEGSVASVPAEDDGRVRPPFLLRGTLRPYQQGGLEWLASLYANRMNGILADEMGLGKTIQTIALLGHLACDKGIWGQHLIIVPTSVILNWEMEFKKFFPGMKVLTYYGNQKERKDKRVGWHTENAWQVCITSYQIVLADQHIFRRKSWVYMILDEAHNIKNFRSQRWQTLLGFKAERRLLLTGTPLQNNLMELWSLLYFLMPNGIGADATAIVGFVNHKEFLEWFSNPMDKAVDSGDTLDEDTLETVSKLHTLLRPFILRRLKSEVETQLPGKFEHVVYCRLSKRQRFLYDEFMSRSSTKEALSSGGYLGVVNSLMQLRKVCNHPDLFEVRPVRTSFAMERSILADFEPSELLVRKRLLQREDEKVSEALNLHITGREDASAWACAARRRLDGSSLLPHAIEPIRRGRLPNQPKMDVRTVDGWLKYRSHVEQEASVSRWRSIRDINRLRCAGFPIYGSTFLGFLSDVPNPLVNQRRPDLYGDHVPPATRLVHSFIDRAKQVSPLLDQFAVIPPNAVARDVASYSLSGLTPSSHSSLLNLEFDFLHQAAVKLQIAFPDASLLQYDCGKLQKLYEMLRNLKAEGHRVLIFTQMTRVLDILEMFLSYNGHRYLRLDGSTKIEDRQIITERFNSDARVFCFIASSRSGGVGINLTGADTVFFYDSDWNPSMDRQCMDRAHRIGQTREVHIYRFVSSHTVEENMLKKANQKRLLDRVVIQEGDFTTEFFGRMDWRDMLDADTTKKDEAEDKVVDVVVDVEGTPEAVDAEATTPLLREEGDYAKVLAEVEDEEDAAAAMVAQGEREMDLAEFAERSGTTRPKQALVSEPVADSEPRPDGEGGAGDHGVMNGEEEAEGEGEEEPGAVDEYMLRMVEWDWEWFTGF